jgi:Leucine-rich repeat (LRR) protein
MTTKPIITIAFIWTLLISFSCSQTQTKNTYNSQNKETTYSTTTQQLKSNAIPDSVFNITTLKQLTIIGMDCDYGDNTQCWGISEIPLAIKNLKHLTTLRLNVNAISKIPIELTELRELKTLDLSDNVALSAADNVEKITSLEYLSLDGCNLIKLPDGIGNLKSLKQLGLVGNRIDQQEQTRIRKALPNCNVRF